MFSFIPLPIYILLGGILCVYLLLWTFRNRANHTKLITIGLLLSVFAPINAVYSKVAQGTRVSEHNLWLQKSLSYIALTGFIILLLGGFQKIKPAPQKKRAFLIILTVFIFIPLLVVRLLYYLK